jgi:hypothetical protein
MKTSKALGSYNILIEVWRCLKNVTIVWITKLFNIIFRSNKMSDEWRINILVSIFKNKGDIQNYTNYKWIKLISHTMKFWERVIEYCLKELTTVSKNQFGFMPERSIVKVIFLIRQLMKIYREQKNDLYDIYWFGENIW